MAPQNGKAGRKAPSLHSHPGISQHDIRRVAVSAACDPRVVVKYLRKMNQPSTMKERIERALRACELGHLVVGEHAKTNGAAVKPSAPPPSRN
jgi:hypothetical protein